MIEAIRVEDSAVDPLVRRSLEREQRVRLSGERLVRHVRTKDAFVDPGDPGLEQAPHDL